MIILKKIYSLANRYKWLIIATISFLLGVVIRFYYGLTTDFWNDEATSIYISNLTWKELFFSNGNYGVFDHPTLYYIFLKLMLIISDVDWWLRLTSLVWFFPSIYLVYKISLFFNNHKTTFLAISFFSLHPLLVGLSFQVRSYPIVITLMLFTIYELFLNFKKPNYFRSFFIGILLALCFLTSYASIWLIIGLFFFLIYFFYCKRKIQWQNLLCSLFIFLLLALYQIIVLFNYVTNVGRGGQVAGSVPYFNLQWFIDHSSILFGNNYIEFYLLLFFVIVVFNFKKHNSLFNQFLFFLSLTTIILSIFFSIFLFPVFLARQLVLFSLITIFVFAQFHQNLRQELFIIITVLIYAVNSFNAYNFLFTKNVNNTLKQRIPSNSIILLRDDYDLVNYYLLINKNNSVVYLIEGSDLDIQNLKDQLLAKSSKNIFFVKNQFISEDELKIKESLQNVICQKHHCTEIEL